MNLKDAKYWDDKITMISSILRQKGMDDKTINHILFIAGKDGAGTIEYYAKRYNAHEEIDKLIKYFNNMMQAIGVD